MKKAYPFLLLLGFLAAACTPKTGSKMATSAPELNTEVTDYAGEPILLGKIDRSGLTAEPYRSWFEAGYRSYKPDPQVMEQLQGSLDGKNIVVFMGTWCSDSQREVPHLFKILDEVNVDESQISMYALTNDPENYKTSPQGYEDGWNIEFVPTIIVMEDGQELGRVVEASYPSLESNLLDMLKD